MTATTMGTLASSTLNAINGTSSTASGSSTTGSLSAQDQSDRFLKLLVAQMQHQDPMNPMDSAQVTSQMAQISTVEGVQTLNSSITALTPMFTQLQTLQSAALVGHSVATEGKTLNVDATTHTGRAGFELASAAATVKVDVLGPDGQTVGTIDLGAQAAGRHEFTWDVPAELQGKALTFQVKAMSSTTAAATAVDTMTLSYNRITAVSNINGQVALELDNGQRIAYDAVWSFV